mgnify:CR=1 FL=1
MNIREAIEKLVNRVNLSEADTVDVMNQIMTGEATPLQVASFLTALRMKGETVEEITGAARVMREKAHRVNVGGKTVLDTCGTGGDQKGTFNISTTAAFVVAGAGVDVAKHGNRSVSSQSGSADVLGALGVKIDAPKERVEQCIAKIGIGFLFAPLLHEAMKYAVWAGMATHRPATVVIRASEIPPARRAGSEIPDTLMFRKARSMPVTVPSSPSRVQRLVIWLRVPSLRASASN